MWCDDMSQSNVEMSRVLLGPHRTGCAFAAMYIEHTDDVADSHARERGLFLSGGKRTRFLLDELMLSRMLLSLKIAWPIHACSKA